MWRLRGCFWSVDILNFQLSRRSLAAYLRWCGSLCKNYIENFLRNTTVKEFSQSVFICRSNDQKSQCFFETRCSNLYFSVTCKTMFVFIDTSWSSTWKSAKRQRSFQLCSLTWLAFTVQFILVSWTLVFDNSAFSWFSMPILLLNILQTN